MSRQTKTIGLIALIFVIIAALIGGSILVFAVSRVRLGAAMNNRQAVFEQRGLQQGAERGFDRVNPPDDNDGPGTSFERRDFHHGRSGSNRNVGPANRGGSRVGGFLAGLRDLAIIALIIVVIARFTNVREWLASRPTRSAEPTAAVPPPAAADPPGEKEVDSDPPA